MVQPNSLYSCHHTLKMMQNGTVNSIKRLDEETVNKKGSLVTVPWWTSLSSPITYYPSLAETDFYKKPLGEAL